MFKTCWFLSLFLLASGQESCDFLCPEHIDLVCGSDGVTYPNLCVLELADCLSDEDITLAHPGACETNGETCDAVCSSNYDPVCGSDGVTYPNLCELEVADCLSAEDIAMAYPGECKVTPGNCNLGCPGNYDPVCGSDGVTYPNMCALEVVDCLSDEDITLAYEGECKDAAKEDCGFPCPENYDPVCGSDGVTYPNLCELERADCLSAEEITAAHPGECAAARGGCDFSCTDEYEPVCGSDGQTYPNECLLDLASCLSAEGVTVAHPGECSSCDFGCSGLWDPVCGTDGVTYSNLCQLEIASCLNGGDISLAHPGECQAREALCGTVCAANYDPVCGSDGVTYGNACELAVADCMSDEGVALAHAGPC